MAPWAYSPVEISVTATPTLDGGRSGSPVLRTCGQYIAFIPVRRFIDALPTCA